MAADVHELADALARQWNALAHWLEPFGADLLGQGEDPSALPGWTNRELVAHLARAMDALRVCTVAPTGTVPLSLAEYLGTYPNRAAQITETTRALAVELGPAPLTTVSEHSRQALTRLSELIAEGTRAHPRDPGAVVVQARRGPIRLRDMVVSRLIELVVHADDLVGTLRTVRFGGTAARPIDADAQRIVAEELLAIVRIRGGWNLVVTDEQLWIALATGRRRLDVDDLARALQPEFASDAVPDLGTMLPLL